MTTRARCNDDEHTRRNRPARVVSDAQLRRASEILVAASDVGRVRILLVLAEGPAFVSVIADQLGLRVPRVSQQLAVLRQAHLVAAKRRGTRVEYTLVDHHVERLVEMALAISSRGRT